MVVVVVVVVIVVVEVVPVVDVVVVDVTVDVVEHKLHLTGHKSRTAARSASLESSPSHSKVSNGAVVHNRESLAPLHTSAWSTIVLFGLLTVHMHGQILSFTKSFRRQSFLRRPVPH